MRSRKAGHLEPFTRVRLLLARGRDFWIVTQAETVEAYLPLREDLLRTAYGAYVLELLDRFTYDEGENRSLYRLAAETLERVTAEEDPFLSVRYFEMHMLDLTGFRPELFHCVSCGAGYPPRKPVLRRAAGWGGLPALRREFPGARDISMTTLKFLRHLQRSSFQEAMRADPNPAQRAEMETLLRYYLTFLLERRLNSPEFLEEVRGQEVRISRRVGRIGAQDRLRDYELQALRQSKSLSRCIAQVPEPDSSTSSQAHRLSALAVD